MTPRDLVFVKLGGSLITDKNRDAHARHEVIRRLAKELGAIWPGLVGRLLLGHGSGSFGHTAAIRHGFARDEAPSAVASAHVARAASTLNGILLDALLEADVPAFSWSPSTVLKATSGIRLGGGLGALELGIDQGFLPVIYGDVILDRQRRASIASTEALVRYLEPRLKRNGRRISRLLWLGETEGIWDEHGEPIRRIDSTNYRRVRRTVGGSRGTDVTGGMLLRLDTAWQLARRGVSSLIADGRRPGLLAAALGAEGGAARGAEDVPGTLVT